MLGKSKMKITLAEELIKERLADLKLVYHLDYILGENKFVLYVEESRILDAVEALDGIELGEYKIELKLR